MANGTLTRTTRMAKVRLAGRAGIHSLVVLVVVTIGLRAGLSHGGVYSREALAFDPALGEGFDPRLNNGVGQQLGTNCYDAIPIPSNVSNGPSTTVSASTYSDRSFEQTIFGLDVKTRAHASFVGLASIDTAGDINYSDVTSVDDSTFTFIFHAIEKNALQESVNVGLSPEGWGWREIAAERNDPQIFFRKCGTEVFTKRESMFGVAALIEVEVRSSSQRTSVQSSMEGAANILISDLGAEAKVEAQEIWKSILINDAKRVRFELRTFGGPGISTLGGGVVGDPAVLIATIKAYVENLSVGNSSPEPRQYQTIPVADFVIFENPDDIPIYGYSVQDLYLNELIDEAELAADEYRRLVTNVEKFNIAQTVLDPDSLIPNPTFSELVSARDSWRDYFNEIVETARACYLHPNDLMECNPDLPPGRPSARPRLQLLPIDVAACNTQSTNEVTTTSQSGPTSFYKVRADVQILNRPAALISWRYRNSIRDRGGDPSDPDCWDSADGTGITGTALGSTGTRIQLDSNLCDVLGNGNAGFSHFDGLDFTGLNYIEVTDLLGADDPIDIALFDGIAIGGNVHAIDVIDYYDCAVNAGPGDVALHCTQGTANASRTSLFCHVPQ